jgi:hypothetical protein
MLGRICVSCIEEGRRCICQSSQEGVGQCVGGIVNLLMYDRGGAPKVKYGIKSPKFIWAPCAQLYSMLIPSNPPSPPHLGSYTRSVLVSQDRRHLSETPSGVHCTLYTTQSNSISA